MTAHPRDADVPADLEGKTALVTGSAQGMGRAIATRLARAGADLVINDLDARSVEQAANELADLGVSTLAAAGDITSAADVERIASQARDRFDTVDILVNNAGVLAPTRFLDISEEEWDWVMDVTVKGGFLCTQAFLPGMIEQRWGRVINMSSTAGKNVSTMGGAHYTTAKTAIIGLTRAVAVEAANSGVTVNAICPGLFDTDMMRRTITPEQARAYADSFPIQRLGLPEEVAELVAFLASDRAAYITGATLDINGGDLMV